VMGRFFKCVSEPFGADSESVIEPDKTKARAALHGPLYVSAD
jgi:hypothetical protein